MRVGLPALAYAAIATAILAVRPAPTPGPFLRDFEAYWSAGSAWNAGSDPYGRALWNSERSIAGVDASRDEILPFVGPPITLAAWSLLAHLPYQFAARLWWAILAISLLALVAATVRASRGRGDIYPFIVAAALAIAFGPATSDIALGQLALPALAGAVIAVTFGAQSLLVAAVAACVAFSQPNVALGLVARLGRNRVTLAIICAALLTYAFGALFAGWAWPGLYAHAIAAHGAAERFSAIQMTPASIAYGFGAGAGAAQLLAIAAGILAILAAVQLARRVTDPYARFAGFCTLVPFVAGFLHEHDLIVAYPAAIWCAMRTRGIARSVAFAGTMLASVDWLGLAQRPTGIAQAALLGLAAACAFLALSDGIERAELRVTAGFAGAFAIAAILATHHPAPVWPDALGAFHAPPAASVTATWLAEQRATGLLVQNPAWALLRSLSLLGCALLAYAIYRRPSYYRTA
jgi:hypothetical protein